MLNEDEAFIEGPVVVVGIVQESSLFILPVVLIEPRVRILGALRLHIQFNALLLLFQSLVHFFVLLFELSNALLVLWCGARRAKERVPEGSG
jgi:hypothetical protein